MSMRRLNKETYRTLVKGVKPDYDKEALWTAIDDRMSKKKKKRRFIWLFLVGTLIVSGVSFSVVKHNSVFVKEQAPSELIVVVEEGDAKEETRAITHSDRDSLLGQAATVGVTTSEKFVPGSSFVLQADKEEKFLQYRMQKIQARTALSKSSIGSDHITPQSPMALRLQNNGQPFHSISRHTRSEMVLIDLLPQLTFAPHKTTAERIQAYNFIKEIPPNAKKGFPLSIRLEAGYSSARYASDELVDKWATVQEGYLAELYHTGLSLTYSYTLSRKSALLFGFELDRRVSRLAFSSSDTMTEQVQDDQAHFYVEEDGSISYIPGERTLTTNTTRSVQQHNHHYNIGLSLSLLYEWPISSQVALYGRSGLEFLPLSIATGKGLDKDNAIVDLEKIEYSSGLLRGGIATGLSYSLKSGQSMFLGAYLQQDLTNQLKLKETQQWNTFIGLEAGFKFSL